MRPFEAFKTFRALKLHFTNEQYDYFYYCGKTRANIQQFEKSRDKYWYSKLAGHHSPLDLMVAGFVYGNVSWIRDIFESDCEAHLLEMQKRKQSLSYLFQQDLNQIDDLVEVCKVNGNMTPKLLTMQRRGIIMLESLVILNDVLKMFTYWDEKITDTVLWPSERLKALKYRSFLDYDRSFYRSLVKTKLNKESEKTLIQQTH